MQFLLPQWPSGFCFHKTPDLVMENCIKLSTQYIFTCNMAQTCASAALLQFTLSKSGVWPKDLDFPAHSCFHSSLQRTRLCGGANERSGTHARSTPPSRSGCTLAAECHHHAIYHTACRLAAASHGCLTWGGLSEVWALCRQLPPWRPSRPPCPAKTGKCHCSLTCTRHLTS